MSLRTRLLARPIGWLRVRIVNVSRTTAQDTAQNMVRNTMQSTVRDAVEIAVAGLPERIDSVSAQLRDDLQQQTELLTGALVESRRGTQDEISALRNEVLALTHRLNYLEDSGAPLQIATSPRDLTETQPE